MKLQEKFRLDKQQQWCRGNAQRKAPKRDSVQRWQGAIVLGHQGRVEVVAEVASQRDL